MSLKFSEFQGLEEHLRVTTHVVHVGLRCGLSGALSHCFMPKRVINYS